MTNQLTDREDLYLNIMKAKSGVLYITAKPGVAKSAIALSIAEKMGYEYIDMRLAMSDETDFKYPYLMDIEQDGKTFKVSGSAVPEWAFRANNKKTIIHFEELNRAPIFVRNAALQILLERQIGEFKFNDGVLMMASGNLGEEDGTDVEEFDNALNNRLIHFKHTLSVDEWIANFAGEKVHPMIVSYIKSHPEELYRDPVDKSFSDSRSSKAYATPRSWTFLSNFIKSTFSKDGSINGADANPKEFLPMVTRVCHSYIGNSATKFLRYCEDMILININDVINRYDEIADDLNKFNRDKKSELIQSLKEIDINKFNKDQFKNVKCFLKTISDDELTGYLMFVIKNVTVSDKVRVFLKENFMDEILLIKGINKPEDKK